MDFVSAVKTCFNKYVTFSGRAVRSEFWYFILFLLTGHLITWQLDSMLFPTSAYSPLSSIFSLVTFLPNLAVSVRRLHDIDKSGWWVLLSFIPVIGTIILIIWFCKAGTPGPNRFGPDPMPVAVPA